MRQLLAYTSDYAVTDSRDQVYGMLGLASETDRLMIERPEYVNHSVETLYPNMVRAFIESRKSLDIICFSELFGRP